MATPNPLAGAYPDISAAVSQKTFCIAGIITTVHGLDELQKDAEEVGCLWLLHPRLQTQECMEPIARSVINNWNEYDGNSKDRATRLGLIAVSFDQRNHGTREVHALANQDWRSGNERHAQDMFASYHGTALDTSHLLTYIPAYVFPNSEHRLAVNMVCGVSLGAHAAWQCLMQDSRITAAVVIVGCPDYIRLMSDRARLSKLATWTQSTPPGVDFLSSKDFPRGLLEAVALHDPAGSLIGVDSARDHRINRDPTATEKGILMPLMSKSLKGKRILNMAGGADKLVPYSSGEPFLRWLKRAIAPNGWFGSNSLVLQDIVFDGIGHALSPGMAKEVDRFVVETLRSFSPTSSAPSSKI